MKSTAFWAGYYGFRSDASEAFIQGYLDEVQRLDQRGEGVACGRGWIPRSKKCSSDKASQTSKEAKARTVEKSKARAKLKGEVKAAKGQKAYVKPKAKPPTTKTLKPIKSFVAGGNTYTVEKGFQWHDSYRKKASAQREAERLNRQGHLEEVAIVRNTTGRKTPTWDVVLKPKPER